MPPAGRRDESDAIGFEVSGRKTANSGRGAKAAKKNRIGSPRINAEGGGTTSSTPPFCSEGGKEQRTSRRLYGAGRGVYVHSFKKTLRTGLAQVRAFRDVYRVGLPSTAPDFSFGNIPYKSRSGSFGGTRTACSVEYLLFVYRRPPPVKIRRRQTNTFGKPSGDLPTCRT